jgi:prefoldin subunit 5
VPFSYRLTTDVTVTINGVTKTVTSDYTYNSAGTQITFTSAPASNAAIEIRRTTSQTSRLTDYASGSVLTEDDLDTDSTQGFFMSQEAIDDAGDKISLDNADFQWSAGSKRIKNITDPTGAQDAATKNYLENTWLTPANKTALTTVNANIANINAVNSNASNVNTVSANNANVTTVANNIGSVNTVASDITKVVAVANDLAEAVSEIETVADDLNETTSEIDTVSNNIANVNTVGGISSDVTTVAGISANVTTVAGNNANVTAVAGNNSNITAVATNATNINAVNANSSNINTVAGNNSNVSTVAGIDSDVTSVAGISSAVTAVNSNSSNINTVSGNNSNVSTVAGISGNVSTVAGIASDVTAVAGDATDIGAVAGIASAVSAVNSNSSNINAVNSNSSNINTVAANNSNITTVANADSNITAVAGNTSNINTVGAAIANVNSVGGNIANVNTVAGNLTSVNAFGETYRIGTSDPTTSLNEGDLFYNSTNNTLKVYDGAGWTAGVTAGSGFLPLTGGGLTGALTTNSTIDGRDIATDGTKLDGIEASATADQTKSDIDALNINADTLDGQHGSYYTGYTDTAVSNLVDSSPAALNTLNELASALGDDANFSTTVNNNIATKLPLAGGTMTGNIAHASDFTIDAGGDIILDVGGGDIKLTNSGTNVGEINLNSNGGDIQLANKTQDKDITFHCNDGGSIITALTLDGSDGGTAIFNHDVQLADNSKATFGNGSDLQIYHNGSDSYIDDNGTGDFDIRSNGSKISLKRISDGHEGLRYTLGDSILLKYDNNNRLETSNAGITVTGGISVTGTVDGVDIAARDGVLTSTTTTAGNALPKAGGTMTGNLAHGDNVKATFGASNDLEIYHDGSHSYISDVGTGNLYLKGNGGVSLRGANDEQLLSANQDGAVEIYYNNSNKFNTTNTGVSVTGIATATEFDGLLSSGVALKTGSWYDDNGGNGASSNRIYFYNNGSSLWNTADAHLFQYNGSTKFTVDSSGNATAVGNVTAYSDERLKSDIKTIDNALDKVSQMRGVTFTKDDKLSSGVIAQEMEQVAPELVMDGEYKSVAYGNVVGYLIEAIKELKAEVADLKCKKECECE